MKTRGLEQPRFLPIANNLEFFLEEFEEVGLAVITWKFSVKFTQDDFLLLR